MIFLKAGLGFISDCGLKLVTGSLLSSIEIALDRVPANVSKIAITVVIDGEDTISGLSLLSIQAPGIADFQAETQFRCEKAIILGEVYRHYGSWKLRALGQGFNGGLEPLAISYGVDVAQPAPQPAKPASISLEKKFEIRSPRLVSLTKNNLDTLEAAVAFVLDASGSMRGQFSKGNVQSVLDRIAVLAAQFDDDGEMDVWGFGDNHKKYPNVTLDNLDTYIQTIRRSGKRSAWENLPSLGWTNNESPAMEEIVDYFKDSKIPVYVVFITDGGISKTRTIKDAIRRFANYPIFWKFVGLGG